MARFNTDGTLDTSFDGDGQVRVDFAANSTTNENAEAMTIQSDGKIIIAGRSGGDFALARLHAATTGGDVRHYVQHDANYNVTAFTDASGAVVERYVYDPYGAVTVLDANWVADGDGISDIGWLYLHQGGRRDVDTGLYHFNIGGNGRDYSPTLGRWLEQDRHPAGPYVDGMNAYPYVRSSPPNYVDPLGTDATAQPMPLPTAQPTPTIPGRYEPGIGFIPDPPPAPPGSSGPQQGWEAMGYSSIHDCLRSCLGAGVPGAGACALAQAVASLAGGTPPPLTVYFGGALMLYCSGACGQIIHTRDDPPNFWVPLD